MYLTYEPVQAGYQQRFNPGSLLFYGAHFCLQGTLQRSQLKGQRRVHVQAMHSAEHAGGLDN